MSLRVRDAAGGTGPRYQYRLMLRQPEPTFDFFTGPYHMTSRAVGAFRSTWRCAAAIEFEQPVTVRLEDSPWPHHLRDRCLFWRR